MLMGMQRRKSRECRYWISSALHMEHAEQSQTADNHWNLCMTCHFGQLSHDDSSNWSSQSWGAEGIVANPWIVIAGMGSRHVIDVKGHVPIVLTRADKQHTKKMLWAQSRRPLKHLDNWAHQAWYMALGMYLKSQGNRLQIYVSTCSS